MIRPAIASDIPALARVHIASWQAAYRQLLPDHVLDNLSPEKFEAGWQRNFADPRRANLVLEVERGVGGFVSFGDSRDADATPAIGEIYSLYLLPELWGAGHGRTLLAGASQRLHPSVAVITLWTLESNTRARKFYERAGFEFDGHAKEISLFGVALPQVRYRKRSERPGN